MINSMTGFGRGNAGRGKNRIDVEIRAINSRYLDTKFRGIQLDFQLEQEIKKIIEKEIQRGSVYVHVELTHDLDSRKFTFDKDRFESLRDIIKSVYVSYGQRLSLSDVVTTNDLLKTENTSLIDSKVVIKAISNAIVQLKEMRAKEGEVILDDINGRVKFIEEALNQVEDISGKYNSEKQLILKNKISDLINDEKLDDSRLMQEEAYYIERSDITEEIVRSKSHIHQIKRYLELQEPVGKRLNFLLQEVSREVNTIGSKSPQTEITLQVVEMKSELEKMREQIQNLL
ncbi:MAG: YicC/YloC family endoribonuclease [Candidatus Neomarinimicrobiota bacterium]